MVQINWTRQAKFDLKEISDYIAKDSKRYAEFEVKRIRKRTEILKKFIFAGKINEEKGDENIRELIEKNYRIIYRIVNKQRVDILTVHHSSRDLSQRNIF